MKYTDGYYEGDWVHDKREGKGKFLWTDDPWKGDIYEDEWKDDKRNGHEVVKYHNGDIYDGEWKDNEKFGKGKLITKAEQDRKIEEYNNDTNNNSKNGQRYSNQGGKKKDLKVGKYKIEIGILLDMSMMME